jgi:protein KTI12
MRFEEPISTLFFALLFAATSDMHMAEIFSCLFEKKALKANQSTQNPPTQNTNCLFELDIITQEIVAEVVSARKLGSIASLKIKDSTNTVNISAPQLNLIRRQYLQYSKQHLFVQCLSD